MRVKEKEVPTETRKITISKPKEKPTNNPPPWKIDVAQSMLLWPPNKTLAYFENTKIKLYEEGTLEGRKIVDIHCIDFDESEEQVRLRKTNDSHVSGLQDDFEPGIDYSKKPPTVYIYNNENGETRYKCYDGHNSITAQKKLGYNFSLVDVIWDPKDVSLTETFGTKLALNNHGNVKCNEIEDYVNAVEQVIKVKGDEITKELLSDTLNEITSVDKKLKNGVLSSRRRTAVIKRLIAKYKATNVNLIKNTNFYTFPHEADPTILGTAKSGLRAFDTFPLSEFPFAGSAHLKFKQNRILNHGYVVDKGQKIEGSIYLSFSKLLNCYHNNEDINPIIFTGMVEDKIQIRDVVDLRKERLKIKNLFFDEIERVIEICCFLTGMSTLEKRDIDEKDKKDEIKDFLLDNIVWGGFVTVDEENETGMGPTVDYAIDPTTNEPVAAASSFLCPAIKWKAITFC